MDGKVWVHRAFWFSRIKRLAAKSDRTEIFHHSYKCKNTTGTNIYTKCLHTAPDVHNSMTWMDGNKPCFKAVLPPRTTDCHLLQALFLCRVQLFQVSVDLTWMWRRFWLGGFSSKCLAQKTLHKWHHFKITLQAIRSCYRSGIFYFCWILWNLKLHPPLHWHRNEWVISVLGELFL